MEDHRDLFAADLSDLGGAEIEQVFAVVEDRPSTIRPGGWGIRRMIDSAVTLLPHPDSPTMPRVSPCRCGSRRRRRRAPTPSSVKKCVFRPFTSRSRSAMAPPCWRSSGLEGAERPLRASPATRGENIIPFTSSNDGPVPSRSTGLPSTRLAAGSGSVLWPRLSRVRRRVLQPPGVSDPTRLLARLQPFVRGLPPGRDLADGVDRAPMSSASTSLWVTHRMLVGPMA